jgi:branched-chain amino acid transport system ATP-binding protein
VEKIFGLLREIHDQGTTILLVEQNAQAALRLADRGYVIESGEIVLTDEAKALLGNEQVRKAYLGVE